MEHKQKLFIVSFKRKHIKYLSNLCHLIQSIGCCLSLSLTLCLSDRKLLIVCFKKETHKILSHLMLLYSRHIILLESESHLLSVELIAFHCLFQRETHKIRSHLRLLRHSLSPTFWLMWMYFSLFSFQELSMKITFHLPNIAGSLGFSRNQRIKWTYLLISSHFVLI